MSDIKDALLKIREHTNNTTYDLACLQVEATLELAEQTKRIADILDGFGVYVSDPSGASLRVLGISDVSSPDVSRT